MWGAGAWLLVTVWATLWSAEGKARVLGVQKPVCRLTFGQLTMDVGLLEAVAVVCLVLVGCFAGYCGLYQLGPWLMGWKRPCGCLDHLMHLWQPRPSTESHTNPASPILFWHKVVARWKPQSHDTFRAAGHVWSVPD